MALRPLSKPDAIAGPGAELAPRLVEARLPTKTRSTRCSTASVQTVAPADASEFRRDDLSNIC